MTVVVRRVDPAEAEAIAALINANSVALHGDPDLTAGTVREWLANDEIVVRLAEEDGQLGCYGDLSFSVDRSRADLDVREHPEHRGVSRAMLDELESLALDAGASTLRAHVIAEDTPLAEVLDERGYRPVRHSYRMLISLDAEPRTASRSAGIEVRTMRQGEERAVHTASEEGFADHWGFEPQPFERWSKWTIESERFDRSLYFLAVAGDDIVGTSLCSMHWSGDPRYGWVGSLAVRPEWRRRGIGLTLLLDSFAEFRRRGCDRVGLGVDAESTTGALELYARAGMHVQHRTDTLDKQA